MKSTARRLMQKVLDPFTKLCERHRRAEPLVEAPTFLRSMQAISRLSYSNELLIFIPLSWIFHFYKSNDSLTFVSSFFAIVPLSKLLSFAIGDLGKRVGETPAGLIQAALGNAVELALAIVGLCHCELKVVQSSLVGSILCKLLLVPGLCFFFGGMRFSEQGFGADAAHVNSSLLLLSVIALLFPATFHVALRPEVTNSDNPRAEIQEAHDILAISRGVAVVLLNVYFCYLVFRLFSHKDLYNNDKSAWNTTRKHAKAKEGVVYPSSSDSTSGSRRPSIGVSEYDRTERGLQPSLKKEDAKPQMSLSVTFMLVAVIVVGLGFSTDFLVESVAGLPTSKLISKEFLSSILLPILGNAEEITIAVKESVEGKLALTLDVTMGSVIQISFGVIPFVTTLAWIMGKPLTLIFDPIESIVLFLSVLAVSYLEHDGRANWLKGIILISLYAIVAVTFWYYPGSDPPDLLASCA